MPVNPYVKGGATDIPIVEGGTGASTAAGARTNLSALDETAHDLLDHTGLTGVGDLMTAAHALLDHSTIPMSYRNIGTAVAAVAAGDLAAGDGTNQIFWDASAGILALSGAGTLGLTATAANLNLIATGANDIRYATNGTECWRMTSAGHLLSGPADNTYDIGATGATRPRSIYVRTSVIAQGAANSLTHADGVLTQSAGGLTITSTSATLALVATGANVITAAVNGSTRLTVADAAITSTIHLLFSADNTHDIGAVGATRPRRVYVGTEVITPSITATSEIYLGVSGVNPGIENDVGNINVFTDADKTFTVNQLPVPIVLSRTSVDLVAVATTALYTVPAGRSAIILDTIVKPTTATAANGDAAIGIGVAAGEDDIFASQALTGLNTTTERFTLARLANARVAVATEVISAGVDSGDTGTALVADVYLIGYLI